MKKFKIIEEGRILSPEELTNFYGGALCDGSQRFDCCTSSSYTTCGMASLVNGYDVTFCGSGISQRYISCGGLLMAYAYKELCGSITYYRVDICGGTQVFHS